MPLPTTKAFRDMLEGQLDREIRVRPADPLVPATPGLSFAIFVDAHLATRALVVADLPVTAYLGAAVALIPMKVAEAAVSDGVLPALIADRFRSLVAEWTPLFDAAQADDVRLYQLVLPGERPPADVVSLAAAPGARLDLAVTVRAYGRGRIGLVQAR